MIFIPGSGFPQLAEEAAKLYHQGLAPYILPSGKYSILNGKFAGVQEKQELYDGEYETEWEFLKEVLKKNQVSEEHILREDKATYTCAASLIMPDEAFCTISFYIRKHSFSCVRYRTVT